MIILYTCQACSTDCTLEISNMFYWMFHMSSIQPMLSDHGQLHVAVIFHKGHIWNMSTVHVFNVKKCHLWIQKVCKCLLLPDIKPEQEETKTTCQFSFWFRKVNISKWSKWGGWWGFGMVRSAEISARICWFFSI